MGICYWIHPVTTSTSILQQTIGPTPNFPFNYARRPLHLHRHHRFRFLLSDWFLSGNYYHILLHKGIYMRSGMMLSNLVHGGETLNILPTWHTIDKVISLLDGSRCKGAFSFYHLPIPDFPFQLQLNSLCSLSISGVLHILFATMTCSLGSGQEMVDEMSADVLGLDGVNCFWRFPLIFVSQS